jgi:hypothetical protein
MMLIYKQNLKNFNIMCGTIKRTLTNKTRKLKFYRVMALSTLLYPCEIWALNRSDRRKIKTADIRFLRHTPEGMKSVILLFTASYRYVI